MQSVKVRKSGISAENAAQVIQRGLGESYQVQPDGGAEVLGQAPEYRDDN